MYLQNTRSFNWHVWVYYSADLASQNMAHDGASDPEIYSKDLSDTNTAQWCIILWGRFIQLWKVIVAALFMYSFYHKAVEIHDSHNPLGIYSCSCLIGHCSALCCIPAKVEHCVAGLRDEVGLNLGLLLFKVSHSAKHHLHLLKVTNVTIQIETNCSGTTVIL